MNTKQIVTGERIQNIAEKYIGLFDDFAYNPVINKQHEKHVSFDELNGLTSYYNAPIIFCYSHNITRLSLVIDKFVNPFVLITHNSDHNIEGVRSVDRILNHKRLTRWYAQNVDYRHPKLYFIPIGIANSMWSHGHLPMFESIDTANKTNMVYMHFEMSTNRKKRYECYIALVDKVEFLPKLDPASNLSRMASYKYCICPEGNGLDTHRLWEAYYMRVVPILLRSTHTEIIQEQSGLPMILLDQWSDFDIDRLPPYDSFDFNVGSEYLNIESAFYKNLRLTDIV